MHALDRFNGLAVEVRRAVHKTHRLESGLADSTLYSPQRDPPTLTQLMLTDEGRKRVSLGPVD